MCVYVWGVVYVCVCVISLYRALICCFQFSFFLFLLSKYSIYHIYIYRSILILHSHCMRVAHGRQVALFFLAFLVFLIFVLYFVLFALFSTAKKQL